MIIMKLLKNHKPLYLHQDMRVSCCNNALSLSTLFGLSCPLPEDVPPLPSQPHLYFHRASLIPQEMLPYWLSATLPLSPLRTGEGLSFPSTSASESRALHKAWVQTAQDEAAQRENRSEGERSAAASGPGSKSWSPAAPCGGATRRNDRKARARAHLCLGPEPKYHPRDTGKRACPVLFQR